MRRLASASILLALLSIPARAARPTSENRADARRFGLDRLEKTQRRTPSNQTREEFRAFSASEGGGWKVRYDPRTGLPSAITGGRAATRGDRPEQAARSFLSSRGVMLGVDPSSLSLSAQSSGNGHRHFLYRQSYRGLLVEFTSVKVHLDEQGFVIGANSSYEPDLDLPTTPVLDAAAAVRAALNDARGGTASGPAQLVVLPLETTGRAHLAWKVPIRGIAASWRYYIDAMTGQVLFRYNNLRFTQGTVDAMVYDIDPTATPGPVARPVAHQYVHIGSNADRAETGRTGTFSSTTNGKVVMSLQGPFVNVAQFRGPSAHYDNGGGVWSTLATPASSPHPYPDSSVLVSTIDLTSVAPNVVAFLPIFSTFKVGGYEVDPFLGGDITDDDQVAIYNRYGEAVAGYIGDFASLSGRLPFHAAMVHGKKLNIALKSNESGTNDGYDVSVSSCLTLSAPDADAGAGNSSHTWTTADTLGNRRSEISLFYHLNAMHDYFFDDVNKSSAAPVTRPVAAMAHVGPSLQNAFYNPDHDNLFFGDLDNVSVSDAFANDATVSRHEYTHYLVEKIWSIQNFGQAGAISEAIADYFAASSLDYSAIGTYANGSALRELDSTVSGIRNLSGGGWTGEIHDDSIFFSQALWDIRRNRVAFDPVDGRSCADGLVFQALLFFPESFREFQEAMLRVDQTPGAVFNCYGTGVASLSIASAFTAHGLNFGGGDAYEGNDGFETAVDISTLGAVSATLYPAADADFWSFGAGPGLVELTLDLPPVGPFYKAYQIKLFDRSRRLVAFAAPPYNGTEISFNGFCNANDCYTTTSRVMLRYNNPAGGLLYAQVVGGDTDFGSSSGVNSTVPYALRAVYPPSGAFQGSIISASYDNDTIAFSVNVSTFISNQDWRFDHAQLRNQSFQAMQNTQTNVPPAPEDYLALVSSSNAGGIITGSARISPGFAARFPSVGTVYLEVFGYNVFGSTISLGLSNPINLAASRTSLDAYNNLFNPLRNEKATIKYAVSGTGRLSIKLYTVTGNLILTLFDGVVEAGKGSLDWNGRNMGGSVVASGVYVVRAQGPGLDKTQKIAIVK
ncbi:MAG: hypothetical protein AAB262_14910 [Elusimicrobiota bacterium]